MTEHSYIMAREQQKQKLSYMNGCITIKFQEIFTKTSWRPKLISYYIKENATHMYIKTKKQKTKKKKQAKRNKCNNTIFFLVTNFCFLEVSLEFSWRILVDTVKIQHQILRMSKLKKYQYVLVHA